VAVWVGAAAAGILILRAAHRDAFSHHYWPDVRNAIWIPLILVGAALVAILVSRSRLPGAATFAIVVIPLLVVTQGAQFFHTVIPGDDPNNFYPDTPTHQFLKAHLGHDRFASSGLTMYPPTALYYGLRTPTGHGFLDPAWKQLLLQIDPHVLLAPTFSDFSTALNQNNVGDQPILDRMGVRYFVLPPANVAGIVQALPATSAAVSSADGSITCQLPARPLRGVSVRLAKNLLAADALNGATVNVTVSGAGPTISSGRWIGSGVPAGVLLTIGLAGENIPAGGTLTVTLSTTGARTPLVVDAMGGLAACAAVTPSNDGLKLVYADAGSVIYQRMDALPRIRWASRAIVVPEPAQQTADLAAGVPADEVVLGAPGPAGSGQNASFTVTEDSGDRISAHVTARGNGYLVVADAMQQAGWAVTVDGKPARILPADHAMVAVGVPAGVHRVEFTYRAPHQLAGAALSVVGLVVAVALFLWDRRRRNAVKLHGARSRGLSA
jgi:hypothetical protein